MEDWQPYFEKPKTNTKSGFIRVAVIGPSFTGKSYLVRSFGPYLSKQYDNIIVFCGSDDTIKEYKKAYGEKVRAYKTFNEEACNACKQHNSELEASGKQPLKILFIFDDYANRKNKSDVDVFKLAISGRHDCISIIMVAHDLVLLDRVVRDQFTHIFLTKQTEYSVYEKVVDNYLMLALMNDKSAKNKTKQQIKMDMIRIMQSGTQNYGILCLLIKQFRDTPNPKLSDLLKVYKAPK